ncbi:unnamed protein product [Rhizophagus irregularis]|nr:unnamed protein product [Rhizophagus irregularis]
MKSKKARSKKKKCWNQNSFHIKHMKILCVPHFDASTQEIAANNMNFARDSQKNFFKPLNQIYFFTGFFVMHNNVNYALS